MEIIVSKRILLFICLAFFVYGGMLNARESAIINLEELENPQYLVASKKFLLVEDNQNVKMYAMKDFRFIKKIGRRGEGPAEFKSFALPQVLADSIMISSQGKVSFFNFSGELLREKRTKLSRYIIRKLRDKYIGDALKREKDDFYVAYNLYDSEFSKLKEFYRRKWLIHRDGTRDLFEIYFFDVYDNKIIFAHNQGFNIEILNDKAERLHTIKLTPPRLPFTGEDMDGIIKDMMKNVKNKSYVRSLETRSIRPQYFPAIRKCLLADGKIYVITYVKKNGRSECYIFNMEGRQLKKIFIPLRDTSPMVAPPFAISGGRLFQVIENEEEEEWRLVVDKIE
jgi:hypothetical protein